MHTRSLRLPHESPARHLFMEIAGLLQDWDFSEEELARVGLTGERLGDLEQVLFGLEVSVQNSRLRDGVVS